MNKTPSPLQKHQHFMRKAFALAEQANDAGEIPIGAVIVYDNQIIGRGYNQTELLKDATAHAEMIAMSAASATLENKYLQDCTLYVTLEPCPMCAGALVWTKIKRIVFGAADPKSGACGSIFNLAGNNKLNHKIEVIQGVLEQDCEWILKQFFAKKRNGSNGNG
ncbi:MAG: nucleoside deaminase [Balneolaceae bacterium]|nr:nucleoside deaminase [Balneolaceae bacterium]